MEAPRTEVTAWRWDRYAPLTGIAAVICWVIAVFIDESGDRPDIDEGGRALVTWYQEDTNTIFASELIFALGALLFVWFIASLASTFRAAEGLPARLSSLVFGGGLIVGAAIVASAAASVQGAFEKDELTPESALSLELVSDMFFGVTEVFGVVLMLATGLAILRTRVLPVSLAWLSLLLALVLFIVPIGWIAVIFGIPIWTLLTSWLLYARDTPRA